MSSTNGACLIFPSFGHVYCHAGNGFPMRPIDISAMECLKNRPWSETRTRTAARKGRQQGERRGGIHERANGLNRYAHGGTRGGLHRWPALLPASSRWAPAALAAPVS
jgi:hypothetical protein